MAFRSFLCIYYTRSFLSALLVGSHTTLVSAYCIPTYAWEKSSTWSATQTTQGELGS